MGTTPSKLGPYPVERELGRGGMGVVYLARDPKLDRPVAIKVLPDLLASNTEALARFDREAKLLASLNHPNIATIFGVEDLSGGAPGLQTRGMLLVLEYIPGDTLAEKLRSCGTPGSKDPGLHLDEALDICRQIALAIEAAHEGGVIHRDLKPGNVKITPDGQVKVLDFGLAKGAAVSDAELAHSPTMTFAATGMGVILGTAGYMSPEQARGKAVDRRTDIWSYGCVLFECLAGKQIFQGETVSDTIAKILERDPDWSALPASTPPRVREILRRCLEKDLKKRQRDIGDVRIELEEAAAARASSSRMSMNAAAVTQPSSPARSIKTMAMAATLVVAGAVAGAGLWNAFGTRASAGTAPVGAAHVSVAIPPSMRAFPETAITPDSQTLIVKANPRKADGSYDPYSHLYSRRINEYELRPIPGAERVIDFWMSQDGASVLILTRTSEQSSQRQFVKLPIDGSTPPLKIANFEDGWLSAAWLEDGDVLVGRSTGRAFFRLSKNGGAPGPDIAYDAGSGSATTLHQPLPGGRGVFIEVQTYKPGGWSVDAWVLDLKTLKTHLVMENASNAMYAATGHLVFSRNETLMAAPFDLATLAVTGEVAALTRDLRVPLPWQFGYFALSNSGTLVFPPGGVLGAERRIASIDAAGVVTPFGIDRRAFEVAPTVSADGRRVAVWIASDKGQYEIWTADKDRPAFSRTIALPRADCTDPVWSPDGQQLAYNRYGRDKDDGVYVQASDGTGTARLVIQADGVGTATFVTPTSWQPDGSALLVTKRIAGKDGILVVPVSAGAGAGTPRPLRLRTSAFSYGNGTFSHDGRFVAYESDESGRLEVYVAPYSASGGLGAPVMASRGGGGGIDWTDDNRLFYQSLDGKLMFAKVSATSGVSTSAPAERLDLNALRIAGWNVMPDGRVLTIQQADAEVDIANFSVVLNWFDELRARMTKGQGQ